jgi:tetratricopeptide (TPR) repeat protein
MNKVKYLSIGLLAVAFTTKAQDIESARKAIDAEQFEKAKSILKKTVQAQPDNGEATFLLGNIYLRQSVADSARTFFQKGLTLKEAGHLNYIGLGQMELDNNNPEGAQASFEEALKKAKKKDVSEYTYVGKALTLSDKPDYKKAITTLLKGKAIKPNDPKLLMALGDAYYADKNQNDAYAAYSNAFDADPTMIRAKMQLGVLLKGARAFSEAKSALDNVVSANPNYGPVYRELAETFYLWGVNDKPKYAEYTAKALQYYEKYMSMTDYSLTSRMRHADFLILAKDYKNLQKEAEEMKKLDKVNPRILRYLGYSSYENGDANGAITALNDYISNPKNKIIGRDYLYLGMAQIKKAVPLPADAPTETADSKVVAKPVVDEVLYQTGVANIRKAVEIDKPMSNELNDYGKVYFDKKMYKYAAGIYEAATLNPKSQNFLYDNFYLGYALYFENADKDAAKIDALSLKKADLAFENVTKASPTTQDAYIYRARVNGLLEKDPLAQAQMAKSYEEYINVISAKGTAETSKPANQTKLVEAYYNLATFNKKDKVKANEYIAKGLAIEPNNADLINIKNALK